MNKEKVVQLLKDCLNEMYQASDPPITWEECNEKYAGQDFWYMNHAIDDDVYEEILKKYLKQIPKFFVQSFLMEILSFAPTHKK